MVDEFIGWTSQVHVCDLLCPLEHVTRGVPVVDPEYTLRMAIQIMMIGNAGAAIVCDCHRAVTIISEHDLLRAIAEGANPDEARVTELGSTLIGALGSTSTILDAVRLMSDKGTRQVSVMVDGNVVGLVTAIDLLEAIHAELPSLTSV
jgi:CBS domain-containing protein